MDDSKTYETKWLDDKYIAQKRRSFELLDSQLTSSPRRILDIGCGYAKISQWFQEKHGSELWLLDGDIADSPGTRIGKYGTADTFQFYLTADRLRQQWDTEGMRYTFVDAANIKIDPDTKFDLVYSWVSCGFHYPVSVYKDLIVRHTDSDSVIVMEFRAGTIDQQIHDFDIVQTLSSDDKKQCHQIRFK